MSLSPESVVLLLKSRVAKTFIVVALLLGGGAALPAWHYLIEWHAHHRLWCLLGLVAAGVLVGAGIGFRLSRWGRGVVLLGVAFCVARIGAPFLLFLPRDLSPAPTTTTPPVSITLVSAALEVPADVVALAPLIATAPDLIAVRGEGSAVFLDSIKSLVPPYRTVVVGEGVALVGRWPVVGEPRLTLGADAGPGLVTEMRFPDGQVGLVAVFALPRLDGRAAYVANRRAIRRVATLARHASGPVIVAGDLGLPTNTPLFTLFTHGASLNDVAWGRGGRLPGDPFPLHRLLAHDHVLVRGIAVDTVVASPWRGEGVAPLSLRVRNKMTIPGHFVIAPSSAGGP